MNRDLQLLSLQIMEIAVLENRGLTRDETRELASYIRRMAEAPNG